MEKEGGLWDDSALLKAFDNAMYTYKRMHGKRSKSKSNDDGKLGNGKGEDVSAVADKRHDAIREANEGNSAASDISSGMKEAEKLAPVKENVYAAGEPEQCLDTSSAPQKQTLAASSTSQSTEDYNQLLGQYYELEEKRQKILQQLYESGGSYAYPVEGSGGHWGSYTMPQDYSSATQTSLPHSGNYSCCFSASCCSLDPYLSECPFSGTCVRKPFHDSSIAADPCNRFIHRDEEIMNTAMGAAERAISSIKKKMSADSGLEDEESKNTDAEVAQNTSSETDLAAVLNAWYAAGFHTGKYLTEQSIAKNRNG